MAANQTDEGIFNYCVCLRPTNYEKTVWFYKEILGFVELFGVEGETFSMILLGYPRKVSDSDPTTLKREGCLEITRSKVTMSESTDIEPLLIHAYRRTLLLLPEVVNTAMLASLSWHLVCPT